MNRNADGSRPFFKELPDRSHGRVSFDDIAFDLRRMACIQAGRHPQPVADGCKVIRVLNLDREAGGLEMLYPTATATAVWILVHENFERRSTNARWRGKDRKNADAERSARN